MPEATARIFEMISAENCCALLVDHQPGLYLGAGDITLLALRNNSIALAKVLRLHNIPTVSCEAQGAAGPMGPLLPEIAAVFPDVEPIYRTKINSWQDPKIRSAIEATGRKKVVCAGITADFCIGLPAKSMAAEGYDVHLVIDASGNDSLIASVCHRKPHATRGANSRLDQRCVRASERLGQPTNRRRAA
jgi:nicotinamidase-related amidase